ncbi:hypothetical protein COCON_G00036370 [Conger conger]|uniref:Uncharacterized protein n=1 Tax=Conger conger TaxID=82655 RepID=A0A9Q1I5V8_CONCO|nr:uncharacterized protein si:ch211-248a14.8 [Conger conger]KAJ8284787.1 hypothetical protein COCON_G00036370 [Conger conger]
MTDTEDLPRGKRSRSSAWFIRKWKRLVSALIRHQFGSVSILIQACASLLALLAYSQSNKLYSFVTHIFISQYRFPYVVPLAFAQVVLTLAAMAALHALGFITLQPYSLQLGEQLLVPSICDSIQGVLALWAVTSPSGLFPLTSRLLPLACVAWTHALDLHTRRPSVQNTLLLAAVTFTSMTMTGAQNVLWTDPIVRLYAPLSLCLHSLSLCWVAKVGKSARRRQGGHSTSLNLYYCLNVNRSLVLGFLCLLHPDSPRVLSEGCWHSLLFLGYLLAMLLLGILHHLLLAVAALYGSPLAAGLMHTTHDVVQPFIGLL